MMDVADLEKERGDGTPTRATAGGLGHETTAE